MDDPRRAPGNRRRPDDGTALGLGWGVEAANATPEAIRNAARTILADPSYRWNAERLRHEICWLPGSDRAVALLARLAIERRPLGATAA